MQNRYAGDIGDFGKLGLLRALSQSGLTLGVNWYLTPDEDNGDGRLIHYDDCRQCDEALWLALSNITAPGHERSVAALERAELLPATHTRYFHQILDFSGLSWQERQSRRAAWHAEALAALDGCEIVFADPDNGWIVPSAERTRRSNKFVLPCELKDYYGQRASVIYYQHQARRKDDFYIGQHRELLSSGGFDGATGFALKFTKTSLRYYFMIVQPRHRDMIASCVERMPDSPWKDLFKQV